nr:MAG TPA: hypothetical protein [Caudoviricetes sp.]
MRKRALVTACWGISPAPRRMRRGAGSSCRWMMSYPTLRGMIRGGR